MANGKLKAKTLLKVGDMTLYEVNSGTKFNVTGFLIKESMVDGYLKITVQLYLFCDTYRKPGARSWEKVTSVFRLSI